MGSGEAWLRYCYSMNRKISIAPMLDWSDRHYRYLARLHSSDILLYTEMITTGAIIHGDRDRFLRFNKEEHPVALQLGGSDPEDLAFCSKLAEGLGYDEINLNVGCPSSRVQSGSFGACLMAEPQLVAECVAAMNSSVKIPVTVKTRIGIDEKDSYEELVEFVRCVAEAGCKVFIIHARKAWLKGLSPKENREIPPLRYDVVKQLKSDFPQLCITVNGGIKTTEDIEQHLAYADGVMIGRAAYQQPYLLAGWHQAFFDENASIPYRKAIVQSYLHYIDSQLSLGVPLQAMAKPLLGMFHSQPGGKLWRRYLSENIYKKGAGVEVLESGLELVG